MDITLVERSTNAPMRSVGYGYNEALASSDVNEDQTIMIKNAVQFFEEKIEKGTARFSLPFKKFTGSSNYVGIPYFKYQICDANGVDYYGMVNTGKTQSNCPVKLAYPSDATTPYKIWIYWRLVTLDTSSTIYKFGLRSNTYTSGITEETTPNNIMDPTLNKELSIRTGIEFTLTVTSASVNSAPSLSGWQSGVLAGTVEGNGEYVNPEWLDLRDNVNSIDAMNRDGSNASPIVRFDESAFAQSTKATIYNNETHENEVIRAIATDPGSHAEGSGTCASGKGSHAEGLLAKATGDYSHAEGWGHSGGSNLSWRDPIYNIASGMGSHAEGRVGTLASGAGAHAEGEFSTASGIGSHAEGSYLEFADSSVPYWDYANRMHGNVASGKGAHAEGICTCASGDGAHAEGCGDTTYEGTQKVVRYVVASGRGAHAGGIANTVSSASYATGSYNSVKAGGCLVGGGSNDLSSGTWGSSVVVGGSNSGDNLGGDGGNIVGGEHNHLNYYVSNSLVIGSYNECGYYNRDTDEYYYGPENSIVSGTYNKFLLDESGDVYSNPPREGAIVSGRKLWWPGPYTGQQHTPNQKGHLEESGVILGHGNTTWNDYTWQDPDYPSTYFAEPTYLVIGDGYPELYPGVDDDHHPSQNPGRRNCFRVARYNVYGGTYNTSGADYAEMFEWQDQNSKNEDRAGLIVTLDGEKIRLATSKDDYILGVVSAIPTVLGDDYNDEWSGKYKTDVFGRKIFKQVVHPDDVDKEEKDQRMIVVPEFSEDFDSTKVYQSRHSRSEWSPVGLVGKLICVDDGTGEPNGYVCAGKKGVATKSDTPTKLRVMSRIDETHIRVMIGGIN